MNDIEWSEDAIHEFEQIVVYIVKDNLPAAKAMAERIEKTAEMLSFMPIGRRGRVKNTYERVVAGSPYIIAYSLARRASGRDTVSILRIIHGAMHWPDDEWPEH